MNSRLLPLLTVALLVVLVALPLLFILLQALFPALAQGSFAGAFSPIPTLLADPQLPALLGGTLKTGLAVALLSALVGIPLGTLRGLFNLPLARLWDLLLLIPFLTPPYIAALSWMLALQHNGYLAQLIGVDLNDLLFSQSGIALVMTLNIFPVVYFAVSRSLLASGQQLAIVARVHGASARRAFWHVTLPMMLPALAAGVLLAFTLAIEEYGVPAALGSRAGVVMLTVGIEERLADWPIDLPGSSLLSLLLVLVALAAFALQKKLVGSKEVTSITGKPAQNSGVPLGGWCWPVLALFSLVALLVVVVPMSSMLLTALLSTLSGGMQRDNLTLRHFSALFAQHGDALAALSTSFGLALGAALITGLLGFLAAWLVVVRRIRGAAVIDALSLLPAAAVASALRWQRAETAWRQPRTRRPGSRCQFTAGAAPYRAATSIPQPAGGDADGICYRLTRAGDVAAAGPGGDADGVDIYLASVRAGFRRSGNGDGQHRHFQRAAADAERAGDDAAPRTRLASAVGKNTGRACPPPTE